MKSGVQHSGYLTAQLLVAMPTMRDPRFAKAVIYMCVHNAEGAMGLIINRHIESLKFPQLLEQLNIETLGMARDLPIHFGGPVEFGRGFVLHSSDYSQSGTIAVRSEEHTSELQSLMRISYAVFCLKKKN